jgi:hypothetical protein
MCIVFLHRVCDELRARSNSNVQYLANVKKIAHFFDELKREERILLYQTPVITNQAHIMLFIISMWGTTK